MSIFEGLIPGLSITEKPPIFDERGYFYEKYNKNYLEEQRLSFVQENISMSYKGTIRGLHWQSSPKAQDKLVTCVYGKILDIALDLRLFSPTFGFYTSVELCEGENKSLLIPKGFAHGFQALTEKCIISYSVTEEYSYENSHTINPLCSTLNINWPIKKKILSKNDQESLNIKDHDKSKFFDQSSIPQIYIQ